MRRGLPSAAWTATALAAALLIFEFTSLDLWLQDFFYRPGLGWVVDASAPLGRILFYDGPKALVWIIALAALALALGPQMWRQRLQLDQRGLWLAIIVIATVPAVAGLGKNLTNTFCPSEVRRYGGDVPYVKLCSPYPEDDRPARRGHCFPAGHASGGFALMGLLAVRGTKRWRRGAIAFGLTLGFWMGMYQMLKGAHYLSHTVVTLLVAWLVVLGWAKALRLNVRENP